MSKQSSIEWTDATWNPGRGCKEISPGCAHCYAAAFAHRFKGVAGHPYEAGFAPRLVPHVLPEPLTWTEPKKVFVNSMSDLFHDAFPVEYLLRVADVMEKACWHTFQVLTKRPKRMQELLTGPLRRAAALPNVWWGVSVENKRHGLPRIDVLRDTPACVRFLSVEPLLEDLGEFDLTSIDWVIAGGESGRKARPMHADWARSVRDLCAARNVPFFFKQWGGTNKKSTGRVLDGHTHDDMPPVAARPVPRLRERQALIASVAGASADPENFRRISIEVVNEDSFGPCGAD